MMTHFHTLLRHSTQYKNKPTSSFLDGSVSTVIRLGLYDRRLRVEFRSWGVGFSLLHSVPTDSGFPSLLYKCYRRFSPQGARARISQPTYSKNAAIPALPHTSSRPGVLLSTWTTSSFSHFDRGDGGTMFIRNMSIDLRENTMPQTNIPV
jgi:hypothetical protein